MIRQRNDFVPGCFFRKQGSFIVISAKNDSIPHLFPGNKPIIMGVQGRYKRISKSLVSSVSLLRWK